MDGDTQQIIRRLQAENRSLRDLLRAGASILSLEVDALKSGISIADGLLSNDPHDMPTIAAIEEMEDWIGQVAEACRSKRMMSAKGVHTVHTLSPPIDERDNEFTKGQGNE